MRAAGSRALGIARNATLRAAPATLRAVRPAVREPRASIDRRHLATSSARRKPDAASPTPSLVCHSCGTRVEVQANPACSSCSALLPPPPAELTYFDLFDLPASFDVDQGKLKKAFLKFQQAVHPDRFSGKGQEEKWAGVWSTLANEGYKTLLAQRSRAEYLLSLKGVEIAEADSVTDPELLMSIMETREELEEAGTEEEMTRIREKNQTRRDEVYTEISKILSGEAPDLQAAKTLVAELRYLDNVEDVCREWTPGKRIELSH